MSDGVTNTCGAKTRSGEPCKLAPINGRNRCKWHGGMTPRGPDHYNFKHGRYSKYLPKRLADSYEEAIADQDLVALRDEAAILTARQIELIKRLDSAHNIEDVAEATADLFEAYEKGDAEAMAEAMVDLREAVQSAEKDSDLWKRLSDTIDLRRRVVEAERRRVESAHRIITIEQATTFVAAVTNAIQTHVSDPQIVAAIGKDVDSILRDARAP